MRCGMVTIIFDRRPMPAPRPRVTKFGTYNNPKYTAYKKALRLVASTKIKKPLKGAVKIEMIFQVKIPKSWPKKKKAEYKKEIPVGDCDNYAKSVKDALNGLAYKDDRQVVDMRAIKRYGETDMVLVRISEIEV